MTILSVISVTSLTFSFANSRDNRPSAKGLPNTTETHEGTQHMSMVNPISKDYRAPASFSMSKSYSANEAFSAAPDRWQHTPDRPDLLFSESR